MNAGEITCFIRKSPLLSTQNLGVFAVDRLPVVRASEMKYPFSLIVNTDMWGNKGKHWIAIYIASPQEGEFFDSLGNGPSHYSGVFLDFMKRYCGKLKWNDRQLQSHETDVCGQYCLFYLSMRSRGLPLDLIVSPFSMNYYLNDKAIESCMTEFYMK